MVVRNDSKGRPYWLAIVSHRRPENLKIMHDGIGPATWYIGDDIDYSQYHEQRAKMMPAGPGLVAPIKVCGPLCRSRNAALTDAFSLSLPCMMIDDDLNEFSVIESFYDRQTKNWIKRAQAVPLGILASHLRDRLDASRFLKFAGAAPTTNIFYYDPTSPINTKGFIGGWCMFILPNELRFDEGLRTKEDYDYTLQHIERFGGVVRCNDVLADFAHYSNFGGVVEYRTPEVEKESVAYLEKKWKSAIRINKRRRNSAEGTEILLNVRDAPLTPPNW